VRNERPGFRDPDSIEFGEGFDMSKLPPLPTGEQISELTAEGLHEVQRPAVEIVSVDAFADVDEAGADPLVGVPGDLLIAEGGDVMVYGDGGAGKTTLVVDLAFHVAAGDDWITIPIPEPRRVLLIENEGPRPQFRLKLRRKRDGWAGSPLGDRLHVLADPWGSFSYADPGWQSALADAVRDLGIDLVIVGPLTASGMEAAGTLQDTRAFLALVNHVRKLAGRRFANVLVHHENAAGKVSGAWMGTGDTLLQLLPRGHGKLGLHFKKVRWSSELHGTPCNLVWAEGDSFALSDEEPSRPERAWDDIAEYVRANGGTAWGNVIKAVPLKTEYLARRRDQMLAEGEIVNAGTVHRFQLWHRDDPARPTLALTDSLEGNDREKAVSAPEDEGDASTFSPFPVRSRETGKEKVEPASPGRTGTGEPEP
jgi:hypothetical protein